MLDFLNKYARNEKFSQNGEEGICLEVTRRLGIEKGQSVEIGGADGAFCSNTALLLEGGWSGSFVEQDFGLWQQCRDRWKQRPDVKCVCSTVDGRNVNAFVDDSCDVFSSDTDGADYEIFKGLKTKPKIVIVEIDSGIPPNAYEFNSDGAASYRPMVELGFKKDYFLLCHTGNLIFVDKQYWHLFPEIVKDPLIHSDLYFNRAWLKEAA